MATRIGNEKQRHPSAFSWRGVVYFCVAVFSLPPWGPACEIEQDAVPLRIAVSRDYGNVSVTGFSKEEISVIQDPANAKRLQSLLRLTLTDAPGGEGVLGNLQLQGDQLVFQPRFPFRAGVSYTATIDLAAISHRKVNLSISFAPPRTVTEPAVVTAVYPSSPRLPENLLRLYLHFSKPMQQGSSYQHLTLVDVGTGKPVPFPFLELGEELWDPTGKRLTVLFDPGRVKQGLKPREIAGPVLVADHRYRLEIADTWKDVNGNRITRFTKEFTALDADTTQPSPQSWQVTVPEESSSGPLTVEFAEPLDHAMLQHVVAIKNQAGNQLEGSISVDRNERRWRFTPRDSWTRGDYTIECPATLEDVAGNSIGRAFEVLQNDAPAKTVAESIEIPFRIK